MVIVARGWVFFLEAIEFFILSSAPVMRLSVDGFVCQKRVNSAPCFGRLPSSPLTHPLENK